MTQVRLSPILANLQGQVGDVVFKRYGNKIVISRKPDMSNVKPSEAQLAQRARFRAATQYSKQALADPEVKALYAAEAQRRNKPVNSVMVADFLNAPTVERLEVDSYRGATGDEIVVHAVDDFGVVAVNVEIFDAAGGKVEDGPLVENPVGSGCWVYAATVSTQAASVQITATAVDRPGNTATQTVVKAL